MKKKVFSFVVIFFITLVGIFSSAAYADDQSNANLKNDVGVENLKSGHSFSITEEIVKDKENETQTQGHSNTDNEKIKSKVNDIGNDIFEYLSQIMEFIFDHIFDIIIWFVIIDVVFDFLKSFVKDIFCIPDKRHDSNEKDKNTFEYSKNDEKNDKNNGNDSDDNFLRPNHNKHIL